MAHSLKSIRGLSQSQQAMQRFNIGSIRVCRHPKCSYAQLIYAGGKTRRENRSRLLGRIPDGPTPMLDVALMSAGSLNLEQLQALLHADKSMRI